MKRSKIILFTGFIGLIMSLFLDPSSASAETEDSGIQLLMLDPTCDRRTPIIQVTLDQPAKWVRVGPPGSEAYLPLGKDVAAGVTNVYWLPAMAFGKTKRWVVVVKYPGGIYEAGPVMKFVRPDKSECVVTRTVRLDLAPKVSKPCPSSEYNKAITINLTVVRGNPGYVVNPGRAVLTPLKGKELVAEGYDVFMPEDTDSRLVDYYFFPSWDTGFVDNPKFNNVKLRLSSAQTEVSAEVRVECLPMAGV